MSNLEDTLQIIEQEAHALASRLNELQNRFHNVYKPEGDNIFLGFGDEAGIPCFEIVWTSTRGFRVTRPDSW